MPNYAAGLGPGATFEPRNKKRPSSPGVNPVSTVVNGAVSLANPDTRAGIARRAGDIAAAGRAPWLAANDYAVDPQQATAGPAPQDTRLRNVPFADMRRIAAQRGGGVIRRFKDANGNSVYTDQDVPDARGGETLVYGATGDGSIVNSRRNNVGNNFSGRMQDVQGFDQDTPVHEITAALDRPAQMSNKRLAEQAALQRAAADREIMAVTGKVPGQVEADIANTQANAVYTATRGAKNNATTERAELDNVRAAERAAREDAARDPIAERAAQLAANAAQTGVWRDEGFSSPDDYAAVAAAVEAYEANPDQPALSQGATANRADALMQQYLADRINTTTFDPLAAIGGDVNAPWDDGGRVAPENISFDDVSTADTPWRPSFSPNPATVGYGDPESTDRNAFRRGAIGNDEQRFIDRFLKARRTARGVARKDNAQ